jgi:ABC-2 type transport system ATP-binding protein
MRKLYVSIVVLLLAAGGAAAVEPGGPLPADGPCAPFSQTAPGYVIPSWDGTPLAADIHVPSGAGPFPLIVRGHGYPGQRETCATGSFCDRLVQAGFIVLVWDERGLGQSGGKVHLLDPEWEGRDVVALIDYVMAHPETFPLQYDAKDPTNPTVGMSGGSYGGGIQWSALVADRLYVTPPHHAPTHYIDELAPEITWQSLAQSLIPGGVPKFFISTLLLGTGEVSSRLGGVPPPQDRLCPNTGGQSGLIGTYLSGAVANGETERSREFLAKRSIATYLGDDRLDVPPTFLAQGLRDTLFPPNQAVATFEAIRGTTEARLAFFPTGHGWSGAPQALYDDLLAWHEHALKGESLPPRLADNDFIYASHGLLGQTWGSDFVYAKYDDVKTLANAPANTRTLGAPAAALMLTLPAPTSYADVTFFQGQIDNQMDPGMAPTFDAPGTVVTWDFKVGAQGVGLVGMPKLTLELTTTTNDLFLFGKFYDVDGGGNASVLYHQVMAKRLRSALPSGASQSVTWDLTALSATLPAGHTLRLAVSTSDAAHSASRIPGATLVSGGSLFLPIVSGGLE